MINRTREKVETHRERERERWREMERYKEGKPDHKQVKNEDGLQNRAGLTPGQT